MARPSKEQTLASVIAEGTNLDSPATAAATGKSKKIIVTPVFDLIIHPILNVNIPYGEQVEFDTLDGWLTCQIEAGKLRQVA